MRNPFRLFTELLKQPVWIPTWSLFLIVINLASVGFWNEPLAKVILITFMLSAMLMMGLYSWFGFEKILALGHFLWIPLLIYVLMELSIATGSFRTYLIVWSIFTAVSLVFDIADVWKFYNRRRFSEN